MIGTKLLRRIGAGAGIVVLVFAMCAGVMASLVAGAQRKSRSAPLRSSNSGSAVASAAPHHVGCVEPQVNRAEAESKAPSLRSAGALHKAPLCLPSQKPEARIQKRAFGKQPDGTAVDLYTLKNSKGLEVEITNYGGAVVAIKTPDRRGRMVDIALGHDDPNGYAADTSYFGALIGRYANRIAGGSFKLNGVEYPLAKNNGPNHLHGGDRKSVV